MMDNDKIRCFGDIPIYMDYHDNEWGRKRQTFPTWNSL